MLPRSENLLEAAADEVLEEEQVGGEAEANIVVMILDLLVAGLGPTGEVDHLVLDDGEKLMSGMTIHLLLLENIEMKKVRSHLRT